MQNTNDVILDVLHAFKQSKWEVDYRELSGKGWVSNTPDDTEVIVSFSLVPDEQMFVLNWQVFMGPDFNNPTKDFFASLSGHLQSKQMDFRWGKGSFVFTWKIVRPDVLPNGTPDNIREALLHYMAVGYACVYSSMHVVRDCEKREQIFSKEEMQCKPVDLVAFVCGLCPTETHH